MTSSGDWRCLEAMTMPEQIGHLKWLVEELITAPAEVAPAIALAGLTRTESRILGRILRGESAVVSTMALAAASSAKKVVDRWPAESTIRTHLSRIRAKIAAAHIPLVIETEIGAGYRAVTLSELPRIAGGLG